MESSIILFCMYFCVFIFHLVTGLFFLPLNINKKKKKKNSLSILVKNQLTFNSYFWNLNSILLIYISILFLVSHCLDYYNFVNVNFETGSKCDPQLCSSISRFLFVCLLFGPLFHSLSVNFKMIFLNFF